MKKKLCKLPKRKEYELHKIVEVVRKYTEVEMVVLFGSYARGNFVEKDITYDRKRGISLQYISDFDILVVLKEKDLPNPELTERRIQARINRVKQIETPTTVIVHSEEYINEKLAQRQYFFCDLVKEGVALYDSGKVKLSPGRKLGCVP